MIINQAKELHNRDEVKVRVDLPGLLWDDGYVVGDPMVTANGVFVDVQTERSGFISCVSHADLR